MHCLPCADSRLKCQQRFLQVRDGTHDERNFFDIAPAESPEDYSGDFSHRVHGVYCAGSPAFAQDTLPPPPSPGDNIRFGYVIHQSVDLGGHIVTQSGSGAMYDTLVNIQSGPRILDSSFQMIAVNPAHALLFDRLSTNSFGYGGDPV